MPGISLAQYESENIIFYKWWSPLKKRSPGSEPIATVIIFSSNKVTADFHSINKLITHFQNFLLHLWNSDNIMQIYLL